MDAIINGNSISFPSGKTVQYPFPVSHVLLAEGFFVILLNVPTGCSFGENIFGVSAHDDSQWQIASIPETSQSPENCYTDIGMLEDGSIYAYNWNGMSLTINPRTGEILHKKFAK